MKKISLLSLAFVTGMSVYAQDPAMGSSSSTTLKTPMSSAPRFGIKGGVNLANLEPDNFSGGNVYAANSKTSIHAGLFVNVPLGGMLRFQPELLYSSQGGKVKETRVGTGTSTSETYEQDFGYVALPLMFQYQTPGGFLVEAGPTASYLVDATKDGPGDSETENEPRFDRFDVAAGLGLGFVSRVGLGFNVRYNFGLSNVLDEGQAKGGEEIKNRVLQIGLNYQFGANK
ncbi:MAG: porin family protein [Chitinophagaceae bacterium]